jgi:hypothetical protein
MPCLRLISFAILLLFATGSAAAETKRVLMLFSNDSLLPAGNAISSSFRRSLEAEGPDRVEIFTEFLDATGFRGRRTRPGWRHCCAKNMRPSQST